MNKYGRNEKENLAIVVACIPWSVRYSWFHPKSGLSRNVKKALFVAPDWITPSFVDITTTRKANRNALKPYVITTAAMNEILDKYAVPFVQCPIGLCLLKPHEDADLISLHDYLAAKIWEYTYFDADKSALVGMNPAFPEPCNFLGMRVKAGWYANNRHGVSLLVCPATRHPTKGKRYLHAANPGLQVLATFGFQAVAPAVLSANVHRPPKTGQVNTTYRTVNMTMSSQGSSCFHMSTDNSNQVAAVYDLNFVLPTAMCFLFSELQSEFMNATCSSDSNPVQEYIDALREHLNQGNCTPEILFEYVLKNSTYFPPEVVATVLEIYQQKPEKSQQATLAAELEAGEGATGECGSTVACM
jgi:hypothetical protein